MKKQTVVVPKELKYTVTSQEIDFKIFTNIPYEEIRQNLKETNYYCPCKIEKIDNNRCMCKDFRSKTTEGNCKCGFYRKELRNEQEKEAFLKDPIFESRKGRKKKQQPEDEILNSEDDLTVITEEDCSINDSIEEDSDND